MGSPRAQIGFTLAPTPEIDLRYTVEPVFGAACDQNG